MEIEISRKDVVWRYAAQFFNLGAGLIILPAILSQLSGEEVGMNYLMLSVQTLVALVDFGFADQFGRNISYVFSGAEKLEREGIKTSDNKKVNYRLLSVVIRTARFIYARISLLSLGLLLSGGTIYMYYATKGFTSVDNSLFIWTLFSISVYFNVYFKYYNSLLVGAAMMMQYSKAIIYNKVSYMLLSLILLYSGFGLMGVVIAGLISPFIGRIYSRYVFYTDEIEQNIKEYSPTKQDIRDTFDILWYNTKKLGTNLIGGYAIQQSGTFVIGLFLPLVEVASYGLMCQLTSVLGNVSIALFSTYLPVFNKERIQNQRNKLISDFSFCMVVFTLIFIIGAIGLITFGPFLLSLIKSNTLLPVLPVLFIYILNQYLELNHSLCGSFIVTKNEVPFVKAGLLTGFFTVLINFFSLEFSELGLLGVVLGQFVVSMAYNHWKWPKWVLDDLNISINDVFKFGGKRILSVRL